MMVVCYQNGKDHFYWYGCSSEKPGCFCAQRGINRKYSSTCDVFLRDMGDHYKVEIITDKGRSLFNGLDLKKFKFEEVSYPENMAQSSRPTDETPRLLEIDAEENGIQPGRRDRRRKMFGMRICTYLCPPATVLRSRM